MNKRPGPLSSLPEPHRRIVAALLAAKKAADILREQEARAA